MPPAVGDKRGPYQILARIGDEAMGEVYKARDTRLDRVVAVKVSSEQSSERFGREARSRAEPFPIGTLHDIGPNCLVMEYIDGSTAKGPMPSDQALKHAVQICEALEAAHKKGIAHRDLEPVNILVNVSGVKLLDFGLAHIQSKSQSPDNATRTRL